MCGIAGAVKFKLPHDEVIGGLRHRGPDEQNVWSDNDVQFIHTRLAIQELSPAGRQPMVLDDLVLMLNGEIYNHYELRKKHDLHCQSHSDTETMLHLYRKLGISFVSELDGMFAFALYDTELRKLFLVRDRAGEKPLYYCHQAGRFCFASELRVLQPALRVVPVPVRVAQFLAVGYLLPEETPYREIAEVRAGGLLEISVDTMQQATREWWSIRDHYARRVIMKTDEAVEETDRLLRLSVERRISSSDLEVGTFLSGGIDSGLVTAMASRVSSALQTFTISFEGMFDEAPVAESTAAKLGTRHTTFSISASELTNDIEHILSAYGEPMMDDSVIPSYYISREAKKRLTVILNGDAGDELFGGYRRYVPFAHWNFFSGRISRPAAILRGMMPEPRHKMSAYNYFVRMLTMLTQSGPDAYFAATNDLLHQYLDKFKVAPELAPYNDLISKRIKDSKSPLAGIMELDFVLLLQTTLLVKMDIASMCHSVETRSPFLSKELLEWVPALSDSMKIKGSQTKPLLRKLAAKYLPPGVASLPKRGFEVPLVSWVDTRLKQIINDHLGPSSSYVKQIVDPEFVNELLANKTGSLSADKRARILFSLLSVEVWRKSLV